MARAIADRLGVKTDLGSVGAYEAYCMPQPSRPSQRGSYINDITTLYDPAVTDEPRLR